MRIEIERQGAPWAVRLLAAVVCAGAVTISAGPASAADAVGKTIDKAAKDASKDADNNKPAQYSKAGKDAKPGKDEAKPASRPTQLDKDRIQHAAALEERVATTRLLARLAALIAFAACGFGVWWLSARWLRHRPLQWLALVAVPSLIALAVFQISQSAVEESLRQLPRDSLERIHKHSPLDREQRASVEHALALHEDKATGLLSALALRPTAQVAGGALLLTLLLWQWTHRRVLQSA